MELSKQYILSNLPDNLGKRTRMLIDLELRKCKNIGEFIYGFNENYGKINNSNLKTLINLGYSKVNIINVATREYLEELKQCKTIYITYDEAKYDYQKIFLHFNDTMFKSLSSIKETVLDIISLDQFKNYNNYKLIIGKKVFKIKPKKEKVNNKENFKKIVKDIILKVLSEK